MSPIEPQTERTSDLPAVISEAVELLAKFVVPLYRDQRRRPVLVGTGFFVGRANHVFLVSAAHVLDEAFPVGGMYFYSTPNTKRFLTGDVRRTRRDGSRLDDRQDVGVIRLRPPQVPPFVEIGKFALDFSYLQPFFLPRSGKEYMVVGFPASQHDLIVPAKQLLVTACGLRSPGIPDAEYAAFGMKPEQHLILPFRRKKMFDLAGRRIHAPTPEGMSGAPVFVLFDHDTPSTASVFQVVGVLIEYRRGQRPVLVATDIALAIEGMKFDG